MITRRSSIACAVQLALHALAATPLLLAATAANAQSDQPSAQAETTLPEVRVKGAANTPAVTGYDAKRTTTATKTDTPLRDVPQSVTVITQDAIKDQGMRSMSDVVRYVPGMNMGQGEGNRDQVTIRGNNTTADFFTDGIRDDVQYFRDLYNIERVEALKGPNAMIFGRGGGGGVINRVEKTAGWTPIREATLTGGSFDTKRVAVDVGQGVNQTVGVRLNAMYEDSGSYRDYVDLQRYGINPTVALALGERTIVKLGYEHFHDERVADRGIPSFQGRPFDTSPRTFFGNPDLSNSDATVNAFNALVEHQMDGGLTLRNRTRYADYDKFYQNVFASGAVTTGGTVNMAAYNNATQRQNLFNQTDLTYDLQTGSVKHKLLLGMELGQQKTTNYRQTGFFNNTTTTFAAPAANPTIFAPPVTFRNNLTTDADNRSKNDVIAVYAQDQIKLSPQWDVIAGLRFDHFTTDFHNNQGAGADLSRDDDLVSPRLGLVYKPAAPLSLYASYSVSYLPSSGDQFSSLTATTQTLEPEKFTNYEIGTKWDVNPGLALSAAVFRLDRTNTSANDPNNPGVVVQTGEQRTEGVELGLSGNVTSAWEFLGGYAYQDAKITSATQAAPAGRTVPNVPRHTLSLWNKYKLAPAWAAGLGVIYQSKMFAAIDNAVTLPDFTRVDAAVFYTFSKKLRAQLNVVNLFDKKHFVYAHNNNNITPGTTRGAFVSVTANF